MAPQTRGTKATKTTITKTLPTRHTAGTKTVPRVTETAAPETTEATTPELAVEAAAPQVTTAANPEVAAVAAPEEEAYNPAQALPPLLGEKPSAAFTGLLRLPTAPSFILLAGLSILPVWVIERPSWPKALALLPPLRMAFVPKKGVLGPLA
jgi:hypothetical protein